MAIKKSKSSPTKKKTTASRRVKAPTAKATQEKRTTQRKTAPPRAVQSKRTGAARTAGGRAGMALRTTPISKSSQATTDHEAIRRWVEERGGLPASVRRTSGRGEIGIIRIDFPTGPEPSLEEISWDNWFQKFDDNDLAFVFQEKTAGGQMSRFNKIVSRESVQEKLAPRRAPAKTRTAGGHGRHG